MKNFIVQLFATLVGLCLFCAFFGVALFLLLMVLTMGAAPQPVPDGAILTLDLSEPIDDRGGLDSAFGILQGERSHLALADVCRALRTAGTDNGISGVFLYGGVSGSWASVRELRQALLDFKSSKKPMVAFFPDYDEGEFYVSSVCDRSRIPSLGIFELDGFAAKVLYYADLLKKIGIEVQVTRVGKYKSAVEPFIKDEMSPENREQLSTLLGDFFDTFLAETAVARGVKVDELRDIVEHKAALSAPEAVDARLIDKVASFDQVLDELQQIAGDPHDGTSFAQVAMRKYIKHISSPFTGHSESSSSNHVAVIYAQGEIYDGESRTDIGGASFSRELRDLRNDPSVKAVVLRVDSPGGSAAASEEILCEVRRLRDAGKKVVVSMGGVAASGGYWISSLADAIVAEPNTITGSIGVFGVFPNAAELMSKIGLKSEVVKTGPFADWSSFYRTKAPVELAVIQRHIDAIYEAFLDRVVQGRKLDRAIVAENAQGRVWSGKRAKEIGLVDELGGLEEAITLAAAKAGLGNDWSVSYPPERNAFEELFERFAAENDGEPVSRFAKLLPPDLGTALQSVQSIAAHVGRTSVLARLPFSLSIR